MHIFLIYHFSLLYLLFRLIKIVQYFWIFNDFLISYLISLDFFKLFSLFWFWQHHIAQNIFWFFCFLLGFYFYIFPFFLFISFFWFLNTQFNFFKFSKIYSSIVFKYFKLFVFPFIDNFYLFLFLFIFAFFGIYIYFLSYQAISFKPVQ